jgi:hypothetical protein
VFSRDRRLLRVVDACPAPIDEYDLRFEGESIAWQCADGIRVLGPDGDIRVEAAGVHVLRFSRPGGGRRAIWTGEDAIEIREGDEPVVKLPLGEGVAISSSFRLLSLSPDGRSLAFARAGEGWVSTPPKVPRHFADVVSMTFLDERVVVIVDGHDRITAYDTLSDTSFALADLHAGGMEARFFSEADWGFHPSGRAILRHAQHVDGYETLDLLVLR